MIEFSSVYFFEKYLLVGCPNFSNSKKKIDSKQQNKGVKFLVFEKFSHAKSKTKAINNFIIRGKNKIVIEKGEYREVSKKTGFLI